jgi:peptide-O-fucosyltransferase
MAETVSFSWKEYRGIKNSSFPIGRFPVLAFSSAPAAFPMHSAHSKLQRYIKWTDQIEANARATISRMFGVQPFLAIHLRNGPDWVSL